MSEPKPSQRQLYRQLEKLAAQVSISLNEFWSSDRLCVPLEDFLEMVSTVGLQLNAKLKAELEREEVQLVSLEDVLEGVQYWKNAEENIGAYLSKGTRSPIHPKSRQLESPSQSQKSQTHTNPSYVPNPNSKHLNAHTQKQLQNKIKLNNTLKNVKNQSNYELSLKIGQANDICAKLKNGVAYFMDTKQSGRVEIVRMEKGKEKGKEEEKISEKKFQTQFEDLRLAVMNKVQEFQGDLEDDLKKVLVEVMCLSSDMKKQIKLLQRKGISH